MGFVVDRSRRWPGPVPYRMHVSLTALGRTHRREKLQQAIDAWNDASPLPLRPDTSRTATDHILFRTYEKDGGLSEWVGRKGGRQHVWLDFNAPQADFTNILLHEVGHAVGLIHEHQRPDRDEFVTSNRVPAWDLGKQGDIAITDGHAIGPFDCHSLMHYREADPYLETKPGGCATFSGSGLSPGDIDALSALAGAQYQIRREGMWRSGLSHIVPFEWDHRDYFLQYSWWTGEVSFVRVNNGGQSVSSRGGATWAKGWDQVITFELDRDRFVLVYDRTSRRVRIDRIIVSARRVRTDNVWEGRWSTGWRPVVPIGLDGFQRDHVLVYDPGTGVVRVDAVNREGTPGGGTTNVLQRTWRKGLTTVMPFRLGLRDWYVLAYHKGDGEGAVYRMRRNSHGAPSVRKVQDLAWGKGWTHFVPYPQHSDYSYEREDATHPSTRFLAFRGTDGLVHFDRFFRTRMEVLGTDRWDTRWDLLVPYHRGAAGRFHLGNEGLLAYDASTGLVHYDQLL
jgi:hypothetical protein